MRAKSAIFFAFVGLAGLLSTPAYAGFWAVTNQLGYHGTVWNVTKGTAAVNTTSSPRDAVLYIIYGFGDAYDYNILESNWEEHQPSNVSNSFFQLNEWAPGPFSVTDATGGWNTSHKMFTVAGIGANATYASSVSRFWQPETGIAGPVTFLTYYYAFTAMYSTAQGDESLATPDSMTGQFTGEFQATDGDIYGFNILFDQAWFDNAGGTIEAYNDYYGPVVPEPSFALLLGLGLGAISLIAWRWKA